MTVSRRLVPWLIVVAAVVGVVAGSRLFALRRRLTRTHRFRCPRHRPGPPGHLDRESAAEDAGRGAVAEPVCMTTV